MARVLVVDDDPDVVEACRLYLEKQGHQVAGAFNRAQAMQEIRSFKPELVILDIMMEQPDDGLVMAQDLRREGFQAPIVMLTSIGRVTGLEYGEDKEIVPVEVFLEKPVEARTLVRVVEEQLAKKPGAPPKKPNAKKKEG